MLNCLFKFRPTQRDTDILTILWEAGHSMTASQIVDSSPDLTVNTVQAVLRKLLKNNLIKVDDIVYSGTVLSRSYIPTISAEEYAGAQLTMNYRKFSDRISKSSLFAALLDDEKDPKKRAEEIQELEQLLEEYKKEIHKENNDSPEVK